MTGVFGIPGLLIWFGAGLALWPSVMDQSADPSRAGHAQAKLGSRRDPGVAEFRVRTKFLRK